MRPHLRQVLTDGRLPECWIPPSHVLECRALLELYHDLRTERTAWGQRVHAVPFHQGAPRLDEGLRADGGLAALRHITETQLPPARQVQVATAMDILAALGDHLDAVRQRLLRDARHLAGAKLLAARLYGVGPITALALTCWLGGAGRFSSARRRSGPVRRAGRHRVLLGRQALAPRT